MKFGKIPTPYWIPNHLLEHIIKKEREKEGFHIERNKRDDWQVNFFAAILKFSEKKNIESALKSEKLLQYPSYLKYQIF